VSTIDPAGPTEICRNCGLPTNKADHAGWCPDCRAVVLKRASGWAWGAVALAGIPAAVLLVRMGLLADRFVMLWVALTVGILFLVFKVARRAAFEVIRARGVPPVAS
jgi:hypothetical protein